MSTQRIARERNLSQTLLSVIFSIFLGIVVVAFVGIGVNTFYPEPTIDYSGTGDTYETVFAPWRLNTGVILLVCATIVMVLSLIRSDDLPVLSNGVLFGGLFTMVYAVGMSASAGNQWPRFAVITVALLVSVGLGYWKFVRGRQRASASPVAAAPEAGGELAERLTAVEAKLDALGRALRD